MSKLYQSSKGEIGTIDYWRKECINFWRGLATPKDLERIGWKIPNDALERMFKVLKIKEI